MQRMICALMFVISSHYGIKYLSLFQLEPCNVMISDIMARWHEKTNTNIHFSLQLISSMQKK